PDSGLVAFTDATSQIAFWNMGARLSPAHLQTEIELMRKVREADARYRRPILIDVVGAEREFHRYADLISSSRHILHTTADPLDYFALQQTKRRQGLPDQPM